MIAMRLCIICLIFTGLSTTLLSQTFPCDGSLILSTKTNNTVNYKIIFGPFGAVYYSTITSFPDEGFDALGFNPKDNYIYSIKENTNSVARLRSNGSFEIIGSVPQVDTLHSYAGDCSPEGYYLCHDAELNQILVFDVVNGFELINQLDLYWDPDSENSGPFKTRIDDFVIDPNNPGVAYAFHGNYSIEELEPAATRGYLLRLNLDFTNPNVGMVTPVAPISEDIIIQLGSLFFNSGGSLYGYGSYTTGPDIVQDRLISINQYTGDAIIQGLTSPAAPNTDGCSCPYGLSFVNDVSPRDNTCSNSSLSFTLTINNRSNEELTGLVLSDTFPEGMIITAVSGNFDGTIATGTGTRYLNINDLHILPKELVVINIEVDIIDIPIGLIDNQAHLTNLPLLFGNTMSSDDPATSGFVGDPTSFYSDPLNIDQVELTIIPPSDCLLANDAQVHISSPDFIANQLYHIKLINQDWEETLLNVFTNNEQTFILDSLAVGEYQLAQLTPADSECSYKWRDTMIVIDPPNEQLQASVESNSPVCEGLSLQLNANIFPGGTVSWVGPDAFTSSNLNPTIDSVIPEQSGIYELTATYGLCEQIRTLDIFIPPDIEASINGKIEYCEREQMRLKAVGQGDLKRFQWSGPDNLIADQKYAEVPSMSSNNAGVYQVIIDNGYCKDTANTSVTLLPSPTISLPELVETDFCETLVLSPEIMGDNNVNYSWAPTEGLTCADCPAPELLVPFRSNYRLNVINEYQCTDSAEVSISLSKEKLIFIPNAFSPNFDGVNDYFQLFPGCGVSVIKNLKIIDRWGAVIYSKSVIDPFDTQAFWDGLIQGKTGNAGVYIWQVEVELVDGTVQKLSGDISLVK